jgi:ribonuclease-3
VLTHDSWAGGPGRSYERLEFLGDSILQYLVTAELDRRHPGAAEGDLTFMRQQVVSQAACAAASRAAGLPDAMVGAAPPEAGAQAADIAGRERVQAALFEALIAACWRELGPEATGPAVIAALEPALVAAAPGMRDPKSALQEAAARQRLTVRYELTGSEGPPHARTFETRALVGGRDLGRGRGSSKQAAEQAAAAAALERLEAGTPC